MLRKIEQAGDATQAEALPGKTCYGNLHGMAIEDFLEAVAEQRQSLVPISGEATTAANAVVLGFYHATATDRPVDLTHFSSTKYCRPELGKPVKEIV